MSVDVGMEAPDFELRDSEGGKTKLSDYRSAKNVILVFYPAAFSPGCQNEFCTLRDDNPDLENEDTAVIGVSTDGPWSLAAWKREQSFPNIFVADYWPHGAVAQAYGVFDERFGVAIRGTFVIDKRGIVRYLERNSAKELRDQTAWRKALADIEA